MIASCYPSSEYIAGVYLYIIIGRISSVIGAIKFRFDLRIKKPVPYGKLDLCCSDFNCARQCLHYFIEINDVFNLKTDINSLLLYYCYALRIISCVLLKRKRKLLTEGASMERGWHDVVKLATADIRFDILNSSFACTALDNVGFYSINVLSRLSQKP